MLAGDRERLPEHDLRGELGVPRAMLEGKRALDLGLPPLETDKLVRERDATEKTLAVAAAEEHEAKLGERRDAAEFALLVATEPLKPEPTGEPVPEPELTREARS